MSTSEMPENVFMVGHGGPEISIYVRDEMRGNTYFRIVCKNEDICDYILAPAWEFANKYTTKEYYVEMNDKHRKNGDDGLTAEEAERLDQAVKDDEDFPPMSGELSE